MRSKNNGFVVDGRVINAPVDIRNFNSPTIPRVQAHGVIREHRYIVTHENVGSINMNKICDFLETKGGGYHMMIHPDGTVTQHADAVDILWHGTKCNKHGLGVCFINPYYPRLCNTKREKQLYRVGPAEWWTHCSPKTDRRYVQPTPAQIATARKLFPFLCATLSIPLTFPTKHFNSKGPRKCKGWLVPGIRPKPGIIAHRDYSRHADGRYVLERLFDLEPLAVCETCGQPL
jgi:hypothetical protein